MQLHGPSHKTVRRRLGLAYHQYRQQLRTTLARVDAIAITVDIWTKNKISFICLTGQAFNKTYESIPLILGFRRRGPSRKTVRRRLGLVYHQYRQQLRETLAGVDAIAITVDIWTKNKISFICLTGHAFNKTYESIPLVLGFRRFYGPHRSKTIKKFILYELKQLKIEDKICAIVSDNCNDIKKAINDIKPGQRFSCIAHNINLVVKNGLGLWETSEKKKKQAPRTTTETFDYNSESENDARSDSYTIDVPEELEDEAISDNEHPSDTDGEPDDVNYTIEEESNVDVEDQAEDDTSDSGEEHSDEQLVQPENVPYIVVCESA
ncbi:unnamed protein product [Rotaria sordida]|uniref:Transposase n=1 Tax=Rotaria sordida TaxID=392033 RepID=A0A814X5F1_9BILA|nr:unnamed protein product [Rotaria sordida]